MRFVNGSLTIRLRRDILGNGRVGWMEVMTIALDLKYLEDSTV